MSSLSDLVNASLLAVHHGRQSALSSIPAAALAVLAAGPLSYFSALVSSSFCLSLPAIFHISSAGCEIIRGLYRFVQIGFHIAFASIGVFWVLPPFCQFFDSFSRLCPGTHLV